MSKAMSSLQELALRLSRWLPRNKRAIWLTTAYELHRVVVLKHSEPWLEEHVRQVYSHNSMRRLLPLGWWLRLHGIAYCLRLHRQGHVLPGVWKVLGLSGQQPASGLPREAFPQWMQNDLKELAQIDAQLCPNEEFFKKFHSWRTHSNADAGDLLAQAWLTLGKKQFDVVVIAPWVRTGGADKGLVQFCRYYISLGWRVALLTTYPGQSTRLTQIPSEVEVLELGLSWKSLPIEDQVSLLARLVLLLEPRFVHNALSELAWLCYTQHGKALRTEGIKLMASLYAEDVTSAGCRLGYAVEFLPKCRDVLDGLITDSSSWAKRFESHYALNWSLVACVHFYIDSDQLWKRPESTMHQLPRVERSACVLWAGRLCAQKRPDLLFEVARDMPSVQFDVYGPAEMDSSRWVQALRRLPNVHLAGEFHDFHDIAKRKPYSALLYTTIYDGMPNVLLEAATERLLIVAPDGIGGLSELLDETTAFCVQDAYKASSYIEALQSALEQPEVAARKVELAWERLSLRFCKLNFEQEMNAVMEKLLNNHVISPNARQ